MSAKQWLWTYAAALLAIGVLDAIWLGWLARDFYRGEMGGLMAAEVRKLPALAFYLLFPAGLVALTFLPPPDDWAGALLRSALVGLVAYGTYDLTNLATLKQWSWRLALTDIAWGTFVSAAAGAAAFAAWRQVANLR